MTTYSHPSHSADRLDDPLHILEEEARAVAMSFGVSACDAAAAALVDRVIRRLAGTNFYVHSASTRARQRVQTEMRRKFNGTNLRELASEYGMSVRHARRIVAEA